MKGRREKGGIESFSFIMVKNLNQNRARSDRHDALCAVRDPCRASAILLLFLELMHASAALGNNNLAPSPPGPDISASMLKLKALSTHRSNNHMVTQTDVPTTSMILAWTSATKRAYKTAKSSLVRKIMLSRVALPMSYSISALSLATGSLYFSIFSLNPTRCWCNVTRRESRPFITKSNTSSLMSCL